MNSYRRAEFWRLFAPVIDYKNRMHWRLIGWAYPRELPPRLEIPSAPTYSALYSPGTSSTQGGPFFASVDAYP